MGFFKSFAKANANQAADQLLSIIVAWNPVGATDAQKDAIREKLSSLTVICEEKKISLAEKKAALAADQKRYNGKVELAQAWQKEAADPATSPECKTELQQKIAAKVKELQGLSVKIEGEERVIELAQKTFDQYDNAVITTHQKLEQTIAESDELVSNLELAKMEKDAAKDTVAAARVAAGLDASTGSFDVATNAIKKKTGELQAEAAGMRREADLLTTGIQSDASDEEELAKIRGTNSPQSIDDQLATLASKVK